jgi:hypothetical protein
MVIDFTQEFKTLDGEPMKETPALAALTAAMREIVKDDATVRRIVERAAELETEPLTLRIVATNYLTNPVEAKPDEKIIDTDKAARWDIAVQIATNPRAVQLTVENVALIKKLIGTNPFPAIVGQARRMLEDETSGQPKPQKRAH